MLRLVGVSTSGYYSWLKRPSSEQEVGKQKISEEITKIYNESKQIYGAPKITSILHSRGHIITERTVGTYMKKLGIRAIWVRPYVKTTIDSDFDIKLKNVLARHFTLDKANVIWVTDITYIHTLSGFMYLTSVIDLFSRKIIGWHLSDSLSRQGVIKAIKKFKKNRQTNYPIIIHSERDC